MFKIIVVLMSMLLFSTVACASPNPATGRPGSAPIAAKSRAPVEVTGKVGSSTAVLTLSFAVAGTGVRVDVHGTNGLRVTSTRNALADQVVTAGQTVEIDVAFEAPAGASNLAVIVSGVFGGVRNAKAVTFSVGQETPAQSQKAAAGVRVEPTGERVKEMPAAVK
jgi:hypothetical protein